MMDTAVTQAFRNQSIHVGQLFSAFENYRAHIQILSLDCFDTLLWRTTKTPIDVFYNLVQRNMFKSLGYTALMRTRGEASARTLNVLNHLTSEVTLPDIYRFHFPELTSEEINTLMDEEIAEEVETCYAFLPIVELIRAAHALNIKIIIVSNTYFNEQQLRHLLMNTLPVDVMAMIDRLFCSSDYRTSKENGLLKHVIAHYGIPASAILHIGDNHTADLESSLKSHMHGLHLDYYHAGIKELFRMQSVALSLIDHSVRAERAMMNPFAGMFAVANLSVDQPESMIGFAVLGPILYVFAKYILQELATLRQQGKQVKAVFLMRDGYLPSLACEALFGGAIGHRIRLSRFASLAASFCTKQDVDNYLASMIKNTHLNNIAQQLLLPPDIAKPLIDQALASPAPEIVFAQLIHQPSILELIFQKSKEYRERFIRYLENEIGLTAGDTLVFVDLGYSGTAQRLLAPLFKKLLNVEVIGRYLISANMPNNARDGIVNLRSCDEKAMMAIVSYIPLFEQLCTMNEKSVIDYDEGGKPIFSHVSLKESQHEKLNAIQSECIRFVKEAEKYFSKVPIDFTLQMYRDTVLSGLTRLLYFPTESEIKFLRSFEFDLNMGTDEVFAMFDPEAGLKALKNRGLFATFMDHNSQTIRTNTIAELRSAGLEFAMTQFSHRRCGLELQLADATFRKQSIHLVLVKNGQASQITLDATYTHDGYYSLSIPVGYGDLQIGILFGKHFHWVQFYSTHIIPLQDFLGMSEIHSGQDVWQAFIPDQMIEKKGKLFECLSEKSLLMYPAATMPFPHKMILRMIFRPIVFS